MAQVRTRKRGKTWSFIFEAGQVNGKCKVIEKGGYPTKDAAYKAGVEKYTDFLHGNIGITSEAITLKDFMTNWLENVIAVNVKATSMQTYQSMFTNRIMQSLGEVKVQDLTTAILDKWVRGLQKAGLSFNSISALHALLHHALDYAVHPAQLISSNPSVYIKVPKNAPKNIVKRTIITTEQFATLLEKYPFGTSFYVPLLLLYHTGMRIGEMLGLNWSSIDFTNSRIILTRQIRFLHRRGYYLTTLKTKTSERYILIDDFLLSELKRWQAQQVENEKLFGGTYVYTYLESDGHIIRRAKGLPAPAGEKVSLVCTRDNGKIIRRENIAKILQKEGLNAHSFRHTHATQLIESGAETKGVAERLGGKNSDSTFSVYVHNTSKVQEQFYKQQEDAAAIFAKILQTNT